MSCEKTMRAVERFLEGEVGPEALSGTTPEGAHAAGCAACRAEVEPALRLSEALQGALLTAAPEGALDRALEAVRAEAGATRSEAKAEAAATAVSEPAKRSAATSAGAAPARVAAPARPLRPMRTLAVAASVFVAISAAFMGRYLVMTQGGAVSKAPRDVGSLQDQASRARAFSKFAVESSDMAGKPGDRGPGTVNGSLTTSDHNETSGEEDLVVLATDGPAVQFGTFVARGSGGAAGLNGHIHSVEVNQTGVTPTRAFDYTLALSGASTGASATMQPESWGSMPPALLPPDGKDTKLRRATGVGLPVSRTPLERSGAAAEEQQRQLTEALAQQQQALEQQSKEQEAQYVARIVRLKEEMFRANGADRAKMQFELDKLSKQPNSEIARKIITDNAPSIVLIRVESYVQAKGARDRTPIAKNEATGFAIAKDRIVTAKHVVQPWKYDPKALAMARKLKEEQGLEVQDHIEIYRKTVNGWEMRHDTAAGTCKVLALAPDRLAEKTQAVEIEWNQVVTAVPGIRVHERSADDLAILEVPGGDLRPVSLGGAAAQKYDNAMVIGTVRNPDNKLIAVSPARAEVQERSDAAFRLNATVPTSFGGAPVFSYDGTVCGIVSGPEAQNLVCTPVEAIRRLAGTLPGAPTVVSPAPPTGGSAPPTGGGAAPEPGDGEGDDGSEEGYRPRSPGAGKGGNGGVEPGARAPRKGALAREEAFRKLGAGSLFAKGEDGATVDLMPLERVSVSAEIAGTLATTLVRQRFGNPFPVKIEAVYAFPLPHDAAVNEFVMQVGDRRIRGIVRERQEARAIYQAARRAGRVASLLEQERPDVFHIAVANIEPAKAVDVSIRFFQALAPQDGTLEYVLPLVIGHRYGDDARAVASGSATQDRGIMGGGHAAVAPPRAPSGGQAPAGAEGPSGDQGPSDNQGPECEIDIAIDAGVPIASIECPSHEVALERYGPFRARVHLPSRPDAMDRDFVLKLRIGAEKEATFGVVAHAGPLGRFLQLVAAPPLAPDDEGVEAREIVFVLDSSGSMSGVPIEQSKRFIRKALASLRAKDVFTVATFSGAARLMSERFLPPTPRDIHEATRWVEDLHGSGGTEAEAGIRLALEMPGDPRRVRIVVFLTDGGVSFEGDIFARIKRSGAGARVFALGVGSAPNRHLLDGMAEAGRGVAAYIAQDASEDVIARDVDRLYARLDAPVLCDVRVLAEGGIALDDVFPREAPDLFVGRTLSILARYRAGAEGTIVVRGRAGGSVVERRIQIALPSDEPLHAALAPIWARSAIAEREREIPLAPQEKRAALEDEIRRLALDFQLVSRVTSFVAVDEESKTGRGEPARVAQPAAVPAGVDPANFGGAGEGR